ncbi:MAG: HAD-IIIA family hydrolase [Prevotella sp.]|nr:HAD-IIIA family hydrolase [Prevotella sp.]
MKKENRLAYFIVAAIFCVIYAISLTVAGLHAPIWVSIIFGIVAWLVSYLIVNKSKNKSQLPRVLFCDLDGTLIKTNSGKTFPEDGNDWCWRIEVIEAIRTYAPTAIHIISNQGGIEKGFVNHHDFINKMLHITTVMKDKLSIPVTFDYCQYTDPDNPYRKPNPGMIKNYLYDKHVSSRHCLMIGDASGLPGQFSDSDLQCAKNAHVKYQDVDDFVRQYNPQ